MTKKGFRAEDLSYEKRQEANKKKINEEQKELKNEGKEWWKK